MYDSASVSKPQWRYPNFHPTFVVSSGTKTSLSQILARRNYSSSEIQSPLDLFHSSSSTRDNS